MHKDQALQTPWDLAYISLEATPQELSLETNHYRFIPDKKSGLVRPGALMPGAQEHISELQEVEHAMQRELFYRYVIRYWRKFHILLALLTTCSYPLASCLCRSVAFTSTLTQVNQLQAVNLVPLLQKCTSLSWI